MDEPLAPPLPAAPSPRAKRWMALVRAVFFAVAAFALWNTLRQAELGRAAALARDVGAPIAIALVPYAVIISLHAEAYRRILAVLKPGVSFPRALSVVLSTEAVLMCFPAGIAVSDSLNPYLLKRRLDLPIPDGLAAIAAKKALIVLSNALYVGVALAAGMSLMQAASVRLLGRPGLPWLMALAALGMLAGSISAARALVSGSVAARSHGLLSRLPSKPLQRWLSDRKSGFLETDRRFPRLFRERRASLAASALLLLGMWLFESVETWVLLHLLHVSLGFREVLALEVVVVMLRSLAFVVPGALGVLDAGYVAFLGAFGVPDAPTVGVAFMLIKRAKELFWIAIGLSLFLVINEGKRQKAKGKRQK